MAKSPAPSIVNLHAALDAEHHAFNDELETLKREYPERLQVVSIHERGSHADHIGRIDRTLLARYLPDARARCYFVGSQGFMTAVNSALSDFGCPTSNTSAPRALSTRLDRHSAHLSDDLTTGGPGNYPPRSLFIGSQNPLQHDPGQRTTINRRLRYSGFHREESLSWNLYVPLATCPP
ncbi:hypothetical protein VRRI112168_18895 [Vreelandella rituensis]|uniref:hypothetical protein n=1 Tax=Vreelandella rituensis TaxID=2282306 RepID=UPI001F1E86E8|nr:hypothetical protein [Halomonas rituensis]